MNRVCNRLVGSTFVRVRTAALLTAVAIATAVPDAYAQGRGRRAPAGNVVPIIVTSVVVQDNQLVANVLAGTVERQAPLNLTATPNQAGNCPILNLELGAIDLTLLGLNVQTSDICLDITAQQGGGLLGDLLCGIANLLSTNVPLSEILGNLTPQELRRLNAGLTQLLNQAVFIPLSSSQALQSATCEVLSLAIGPLDLNLLGLRVELDDCAGGPVTLDIVAIPGGGLLGDLLCSLSDLLSGGNPNAIPALLRQIANLLGQLLQPPV